MATRTALIVVSGPPDGSIMRQGSQFCVEQTSMLRAYDLDTGALLAEKPFLDRPGGNPITYMADGRQYIAIPVNNEEKVPQLVAFALPE